jgi:DNA-binding transcriptional ArsR family regulator
MEKSSAVTALSALAHETRIDVFRLLVREGVTGAPAGAIAETLGVPRATLSFHLATLKQAGLVRARRESRNIIYHADFAAMNAMLAFLTENCCAGSPGAGRASLARLDS